MDDTSVDAVATAIQEYLLARPDSADTLEGIHYCWIRWPLYPAPMEVTQAALERLEASGVVERIQAGNRPLWRRRNPPPLSAN